MPTRKTATVRARIEPALKQEADSILEQIGLSQSDFMTMAYKQLVMRRGLPFSTSIPLTSNGDPARERRLEDVKKAIEAIRKAGIAAGRENSTDYLRRMRKARSDYLVSRHAPRDE